MRQGSRRWPRSLLRGAQMRVDHRPQPLQALYFGGELLGFKRDTIKVFRLGWRRRNRVRLEWPFAWQFLGLDIALPDLQKQTARRLGFIRDLLTLSHPPTEDHHLLELPIHRTVDAQVSKMACQPTDEFGIQHVGRNDEHQYAVVLQQRQTALIEQLLQPWAALALVADVAIDTAGQVAIGRVEPQQSEGLPGDQRVHQVALQTTIDQLARMGCAFSVVFDGKRLYLLTPEDVGSFGDSYAFAGAGVENAQVTGGRRQCGKRSFQRGFVRREVAILDEIAREARKHKSHENLL